MEVRLPGRFRLRRWMALICVFALVLTLAGCGQEKKQAAAEKPPKAAGLKFESKMKTKYARHFSVYRYEGGYQLIRVKDDADYLLVPEGKKVPEGLPKKITVLRQPLENIYLAATAAMAMFQSADALDTVRMSSLPASGWSFAEPRRRMKAGKILYAGKYSEPDYEKLVKENCGLAVESTMIYHTPEVKEMIEDLNIPVFVDRSSYEEEPLGRAEWIRLYGVMTGHEKEADAFFEKQVEEAGASSSSPSSKHSPSCAFFYISSDGKAVVRAPKDYIPAMIREAGGTYVFQDIKNPGGSTSVDLSMEQFYDLARDADILIYNGSIDSSVRTLAELKAKDPAIADLAAVKNGNCWVTGTSMYQRTDLTGKMIRDFRTLLNSEKPSESDMTFISKLK